MGFYFDTCKHVDTASAHRTSKKALTLFSMESLAWSMDLKSFSEIDRSLLRDRYPKCVLENS